MPGSSSRTRAGRRRAPRRRWPRRASGLAATASPVSGRRTEGPGPRRLPADRRRPRPWADAAVRVGGLGRRPSPPATGHDVAAAASSSEERVARERGCLDAVTAGLLFMAGMRRSEVSALGWADVADAADGDGAGLPSAEGRRTRRARRGTPRFVKGAVAGAGRTRAAAGPVPEDPRRAALAEDGGAAVPGGGPGRRRRERERPLRRVGLASELTSPGASTPDVMLAGNRKTSRMVAHYSAGATAERGAVSAVRGCLRYRDRRTPGPPREPPWPGGVLELEAVRAGPNAVPSAAGLTRGHGVGRGGP